MKNNKDIILPRPFTVFDFNNDNELGSNVRILYKLVGKGTEEISKLIKGDEIEFIFPLGNSFPIIGNRPLLVAGGTGIASLHYLARFLKKEGMKFSFIAGVKNYNEYAVLKDVLNDYDVCWAVENGSQTGTFKGTVIELFQKKSDIEYDALYICGPNKMLETFANQFYNLIKTNVYFCLEARMACGVGACFGCAIQTKYGYKLCCSDGPVFQMSDILWKNLP
ncbi:MAG: iron-sulfur cluster-binding protein [bacterium]